jgi:hypothetical protein
MRAPTHGRHNFSGDWTFLSAVLSCNCILYNIQTNRPDDGINFKPFAKVAKNEK